MKLKIFEGVMLLYAQAKSASALAVDTNLQSQNISARILADLHQKEEQVDALYADFLEYRAIAEKLKIDYDLCTTRIHNCKCGA